MSDPAPPLRHIAGTTTRLMVGYVRDRIGDDGVARLLARAGDQRAVTALEDEHGWSSYDQTIALFEAAAHLLDDPTVGRRMGEEVIRQTVGTPIVELLRTLGSPGEMCREIARTSAKFQTIGDATSVEIEDDHALIGFTIHDGFTRNRLHCDYMIGLLSQIPVLFGLPPGDVDHDECQVDGGHQCLYAVRWSHRERPAEEVAAQRIELLTAHTKILQEQVHDLLSTTADLVSADDVATVLARIAARATGAVRAPRYVLALRGTEHHPPSVHHDGLNDADAAAVATDLLAGRVGHGSGSRLVVDVTSARRDYGRLAALYDEEGRFFPDEEPVLAAYARNAAAALDAAHALEEAKRGEQTARGLLHVARSLSDASTPAGVAKTISTAVPVIAGCTEAELYRVAPSGTGLRRARLRGPASTESDLDALASLLADTPSLLSILSAPAPTWVDVGDADTPLAGWFARSGVAGAVFVPVVAAGEALGVIVASWHDVPPVSDGLTERLAAVADQAATALRNAELIEQVRHQALHDALTGLPNQVLFRDRADQALAASARDGHGVAVMFCDLDRFKLVNDTLGHSVGNELLCQVTARLLRAAGQDVTVARQGGDEFTLLVPETSGARELADLADRILTAIRAPLCVSGEDLQVSGSIGIAVAPEHGTSTEDLLRYADLAMYEAKQAGRDTWRLAAEGVTAD